MKAEELWVLWGESATPRPVGRGAVRTCAADAATKHLRGKSCTAVTANTCGVVMSSVKNAPRQSLSARASKGEREKKTEKAYELNPNLNK